MIFLKLGGSLITDKKGVEAVQAGILTRLAQEIAAARVTRPDLRLVVGHGSGSFGHVPAAKYGTRQGVKTTDQWRGFAEVSKSALRLNRLVTEALLAAGIPAVSFQPSASAVCEDGRLNSLALAPIEAALGAGLLPVIHGDVAFDTVRGGTILSTEEILSYLAQAWRPSWLLLAGETEGVYDQEGMIISEINKANFSKIRAALSGSRGTDVTGGMASKVAGMLDLVGALPGLSIRIFSGLRTGQLERILLQPASAVGTLIQS